MIRIRLAQHAVLEIGVSVKFHCAEASEGEREWATSRTQKCRENANKSIGRGKKNRCKNANTMPDICREGHFEPCLNVSTQIN